MGVLVPAIGASDRLDCMMGFFASSSFAEIAPGLATYLRETQCPVRLLISPYVSAADQAAMRDGLLEPAEVAGRILGEGLPDADDLARHTVDCLAWLIREGRLEFRIALQKDGLFHPKVWLMRLRGERLAFHGSGNMTNAGLTRNKEQVGLARAWMDVTQAAAELRLREEFNEIWDGDDPSCVVVRLPAALEQRLLREYGVGAKPDEAAARRLWRQAKGLTPVAPDERPEEGDEVVTGRFQLPGWLNYDSGPFQHQGRAVDSWLAANGRGVLAMATGSGKTLTALVACWKLHQDVGPLLIVIAAPYVPLVSQWCDEVTPFGVRAYNLTGVGPTERRKQVGAAGRRLAMGLSEAEVLVVSHDTLTDPAFHAALEKVSVRRVLIADEMHNLGGPTFLANPPEFFEYRLGLSATPVRQYDPEGTDKLFSYFGPTCFEFLIDEAIGVCLVPYDYHVERVELTVDEMEAFKELTEKIRKVSWKIQQGIRDTYLDNLLRQRRLIVETAENKLTRLGELLDIVGARNLHFELIYATDKDPDQLVAVNALLRERGVLYHQLTAGETADRRATRDILANYQSGDLQVLTAKRVLDEGVNVPQIRRAFILASTTVERQWVQRRGRILRKCDAIGKTFGVIHDFVAMPPPEMIQDPDAKQLVGGEFKRVYEFARLARNFGAADGPIAALEEMQALA